MSQVQIVSGGQPATKRRSEPGIPTMSSAQHIAQLLGSINVETSDQTVFRHRRVRVGTALIRAGDAFRDLYIVNGGYFKTTFTNDAGHEQVMNFPMRGALIGADGIGTKRHINDVVALSEADVIVVPFDDLAALTKIAPRIEESLFCAISCQLIEEQLSVSAISLLSAQARVAKFLLSLGQRMGAQGYSHDAFVLQMSRQDIGSHLAMKIETVSRTLTALTKKGMIAVEQREITIVDRDALEAAAVGESTKKPVAARMKISNLATKRNRNAIRQPSVSGQTTPWSALTDIARAAAPVAA